MTPSAGRKPVTRKSAVVIRDGSKRRELVVTVHAEFVTLRPLGTRREEVVGLEAAYYAAIKARVFRDRMLKAKARKERAELNAPRGKGRRA